MNKGVGTGNSRHAIREVWTPPETPPPPPPSENSIVVLVQKEDPLQVLL